MPYLSKEKVLEFQQIYKEEYGKELLFTEATEAANNLIGFFDLLLKIDKRNEEKEKSDKREYR